MPAHALLPWETFLQFHMIVWLHLGLNTLCYAIMLPGRKSAFRAGFEPDCYRESTEMAFRPAFGRPADRFRCVPGSSPAKIRRGRPFYGPEALVRQRETIRNNSGALFLRPMSASLHPGSLPSGREAYIGRKKVPGLLLMPKHSKIITVLSIGCTDLKSNCPGQAST